MDLSFPSIKLSGMKFLPSASETKMGGVAAKFLVSPASDLGFNIML